MAVRGNRYSIFETRPETSSVRTVVLFDRHVFFLDRIAIEARVRKRLPMSRSEIVYAVIEAAIRSGIDLSEAASEDEITELMTHRSRRRSYRSGSAKYQLPGWGRKK